MINCFVCYERFCFILFGVLAVFVLLCIVVVSGLCGVVREEECLGTSEHPRHNYKRVVAGKELWARTST